MKHAVSLLRSTSLPVAEIAYQIGYDNAESFIRTFKKEYGKTPTAYRKDLARNYVF